MGNSDLFSQSVMIAPIYKAELRFLLPFYESRLESLHRHWVFSKEFITSHLTELGNTSEDGSAGFQNTFDDVAKTDIDLFPSYLRGSTITLCFSLFETLLGDVADEVASDLGEEVSFEERQLPYINRYIRWLNNVGGLHIEVEKKQWKELDAVRELRNRFIHRMDRDLPEQIRKTLKAIQPSDDGQEFTIDDDFVDLTFRTMADLAKRIELAYWSFFDSHNKRDA